jgi:hypothetical protein
VSPEQPDRPESRWPAAAAVLAVVGLRLALPEALEVGPRWVHPAVTAALLAATVAAHATRRDALNRALGFALAGALTVFMTGSLALLVADVPRHTESPADMLRSAAALWVTNVLVFAYWYWRLDGGGPHNRDLRVGQPTRAFLFPQMLVPDGGRRAAWGPAFVDYLFVAFNTSTAFSPTDTAVLSRPAKVLTMLQASVSLTVVVVLAARAINIV